MARWRARRTSGVLAVTVTVGAMAAVSAAGPSSAAACRNYLTDNELEPRFDTQLPVPADLPPYYRKADGTPVWVLHALEYTWRPAAGVCIDKWGFEGTTPAPTIRVEPNQRAEVDVFNMLPERLYNPFV